MNDDHPEIASEVTTLGEKGLKFIIAQATGLLEAKVGRRQTLAALRHVGAAVEPHPEMQYLDLLEDLLDAPTRQTRNDTATGSLFGRQMRFDLADGFPLLTTKRLPFRIIAAELLWFLSGSTNAKVLEDQGINIWREWGPESREMGPIYGQQMRRWRNPKRDTRISRAEIDQVAQVLQGLRDDPYSRRHVMTLWNPADLPDMALPPCHGIAIQLYVGADERLNLAMYQRSADAFLGLPFNIASYALLLSMFAEVLGRQAGEFVWMGGDVHLYGDHVEQAREQVSRRPLPFPSLFIKRKPRNMDDWNVEDFTLNGYNSHPHIPAKVSR